MSNLDHAAAHERIADLALEAGALDRLSASADPADAALRDHLAACDTCAADVSSWLDVHAHVAAALEGADASDVARIAAPAALRERILRRSSARRLNWLSALSHRPRLSLRQPLLATLAVIAIVAVVGAGAAIVGNQAQLEAAQSGRRALADALATASRVLSDPDHRAVALLAPAGGAGMGTLAWTRHDLVVLAADLPAPPAGQVYRCWLEADPGSNPRLTRIGYMHFVDGQAFWASSLDDWAQIDLEPGYRMLVALTEADSTELGLVVLEGTLPN